MAKGSPAINSGMDTGMYVPLDLEGNVRPAHGVFEMGAYEYTEADGSLRILKWLERQ
ncbi:MAG: choice-of-anchor Q domain-containing protein [Pirellulaceae bacterium]